MTATDPPPAAPNPAAGVTSTGLDPHVAGLLSYLAGWIGGLVIFLIEKEHREVRFHAAQSILLSIGLVAIWIVITIVSMIPVVGLVFFFVGIVLGLASFGLWIYLVVQGYKLNHVSLPIIGAVAERWAAA